MDVQTITVMTLVTIALKKAERSPAEFCATPAAWLAVVFEVMIKTVVVVVSADTTLSDLVILTVFCSNDKPFVSVSLADLVQMSSPSLSGLAQKVSRVDIGLANTDTAAKAAAFRNMGITIGYELIGLG